MTAPRILRATRASLRGVLTACAFLVGPIGSVSAQQVSAVAADTFRLTDARSETLRGNPMLRAARIRADMAAYRAPQGGALPDPVVGIGLRNRPLDGFGTDERMTMNVLEVSQRFPWPGSLGSREKSREHFAQAETLEADDVEALLLARVTGAYYRIAAIDRSAEVLLETGDLLRDFERVTGARYSVGEGLQQDVLQAQIAVARTEADLRVLVEQRSAAGARLNALLGRIVNEPIGPVELPMDFAAVPSVEVLMERAAALRPALLAARERIRAAEAGVKAAHRASYPELSLMLGYGQRPQYADMATIMVGVSVPLWSGSKQTPRRREAEADAALKQAQAIDLYSETFARLSELRAAAERARDLANLYRTSILPQAGAAVESALSAYRVGKVDYMTLLANQLTVHRYRLDLLQLTAEYHTALAEIEALTGMEVS